MKKRSNQEASLKNVLEEMLQSYQIKDKFSEKALTTSWERLLGKTIANRTEKLFIKDKVLFVELNSAALKHEMNSSKERIMKIFKDEFGEGVITGIVFL